ncbi:DUF4097 family beta strand repeat-containing protein [Salinibacter altiplanensis]|uniref:DUF4097 family beta strand repeat-containing protein n=1 Tax=Salinibacter altiplanensis TaxID=1803181 RepID=UPI000C9F4959|nr:DUF4097 family beta strand repeat-containing protein [Salinibacter altiplanensis]
MPRPAVLWTAVLGLMLGLGTAPIAAGQPSSPSSPDIIRDTVRLAPDGTVEIDDTRAGTITVTTWDRDRIAYEIAPVSDEDSMLTSIVSVSHTDQEFAIDQDGASWSIRIPGLLRISPSGGKNLAARYRITMPATAMLEVDDINSTIEVSNLEADMEIDTHQGEVVVDSAGGMLDLRTHTGQIHATGVRGGVALEVHAGDASVSFEDFAASSTAETVSGTLRFFLPAEAGFSLQTDRTDAVTVGEAFGSSATDDERWLFNGGGPTLTLDTPPAGTVEVRSLKAPEGPGQR